MRVIFGLTVCLGLGLAAAGQGGGSPLGQNVAPPPLSSASGFPVSGRVICVDTQRPARFTQVTLLPAETGDRGGGRGRRLSARTDLDGNFTVANVPVGDYYLAGALIGYVNPTNLIEAALSAGTDPEAAAPGTPLVHVSNGGATAALSLQRGGTVAGSVQWDDGSPAVGVQIVAQLAPTTGTATSTSVSSLPSNGARPVNFGQGFGAAQTDDRGRYRLSGLAPGSYLVRAGVQVPVPTRGEVRALGGTFSLFIYAPDKLRRTDAAPVTIAAAEEHPDLNIVMALAGLHSVSGSVGSSNAPVRSGTVSLTDQTDSNLNRSAFIAADGSFVLVDVPPGNYSLAVNASSQAPTGATRGEVAVSAGVRFQPLQESLTVADSDVTALTLNVNAATGTP